MKRPLGVTMLALGVLILTGVHLTRFVLAIREWTFLSTLPLTTPPLYLALSGLLWGLVGLPLCVGLWRGWPRARLVIRWVAPLYVIHVWLDRSLLASSPAGRVSQPFRMSASVVLLALLYWTLSRRPVKRFFGEMHE